MASPFLQSIRNDMRQKTEKTELYWIRMYTGCQRNQHSVEMGSEEITSILRKLAEERCAKAQRN